MKRVGPEEKLEVAVSKDSIEFISFFSDQQWLNGHF